MALHGTPVEHLLTPTRREPHRVTPFALREGEHVRYDGGSQLTLDL